MMGCWSTGSLSKRLQNTLRAWRRKKSIARRRRQDTQETRPHSPTCHICHAGGWFCHAEDGPGRLPEVGGSEASRRCFSWSKRSRQGCSWSGGYWVAFQLHSLYTSVAASIDPSTYCNFENDCVWFLHQEFQNSIKTCCPAPVQQRAVLKRFIDSLLSKMNKLRTLIRDLKTNYSDDPTVQLNCMQFILWAQGVHSPCLDFAIPGPSRAWRTTWETWMPSMRCSTSIGQSVNILMKRHRKRSAPSSDSTTFMSLKALCALIEVVGPG